ncbi:hypothetical protein TL08_02540 [Actinoalloteichus hymeniacidonis]|uniref:Uncharacterized protein n=1 Tax=Actinoalloteichus hymeniacidonis TaxID=340345 RepID=A0AAC9HLH3_9PSEU|nr:hypothetical protein TL08_02540 [Actinoalloteichus hymeniacidonis]
MSRSIVVYLLAGWREDPFFYYPEQGERWYNHSIEEAGEDLQLPAGLVADLTAWDDEYQATYDPSGNRGLESGFSSPEVEEAWRERGKVLAARIKAESTVVASVDYQANGVIEEGSCVF